MATPVDPQTPAASGRKKPHVSLVEVSPCDEDLQEAAKAPSSPDGGAHLSVWSAGLFISKWRSAHRRGVRARLYAQDPEYRRVLHQHEIQLRSTVPLPLGSAMEEETLRILQDVEKSYRRGLGPHHNLTADAQRRIQTLTDRISAKSVREEQPTSVMNTVRDWWSRRTAGRRADTHNNP